MRSARMILATAAASAVLAITAPGAYAYDGDWEKGDDSSYSKKEDSSHEKEHEKEHGKEHDKDYGKEHGKPSGGVHTGGGALTAVKDADKEWSKDDSSKEDSSWSKDDSAKEDSWSKEDSGKEDSSWSKEDKEESKDHSWSGGHEKPSGGVHTGGGALAAPAVTAGGLAVLAVAGAGLYTARRKKTAGGLA
ncbi:MULTISPECIES: hypothetical protein [Streptomyces]|uniref:Gram-positive cocci surface proteins LPxTG domain-containing protein n=2 Tax=Streptomyces TaxID=1883 RepID=A0ABV9J426_9ACTN